MLSSVGKELYCAALSCQKTRQYSMLKDLVAGTVRDKA